MKNHHFLYLLINLGTIFFPFLLSFDKKVYFKQYWPALFKSIFFVGLIFIIWDVFFTYMGIWGFNSFYHLPFKIFHLPVEEMLFFLTIPYACSFIYKTLKAYFNIPMKEFYGYVWIVLIIISFLIVILFWGSLYTKVTFMYSIVLLYILYNNPSANQPYYFWAYVISIVPFILVNGLLTGMFTPEPVVWYNDAENLGMRLISIPLDDFSYSFNLLVSVMLGMDYFQKATYLKV